MLNISFFSLSLSLLNQGENKEFTLMVSMRAGTTKMYEYDGFQFFPTPITFTGGSLGRGVSKMRTFKLNNDFLVLGNAEI